MDLDTLLGRFEAEYMELNSISPERRVVQLRLLRRLAESLDGRSLDDLTAQDVARFVGAAIKGGICPNTGRKYTIMIRSFASWASDAKIVRPELMSELKLLGYPRGSAPQNLPNPYKITEVRELKRLLAEKYPALPTHGRGSRSLARFLRGQTPALRKQLWRHARRLQFEAQIALALEQALRRVEIYRLSIPAMHYDNDQVVVLTAKQGPGSKVERAIPYTTHARACVQEWLDFRSLLKPDHDQPWLALSYGRPLDEQLQPLTPRAMSKALQVFGPGWRWHRLRHTACTEWLRSTPPPPIERVQIFMGHARIEQTLAYAKIVNSDIEHAFGQAEADFARRLGLAA